MKELFRKLVEDAKLTNVTGETLTEPERKKLYADRHKDLKLVDLAVRMKDIEALDAWLEGLGKFLHAEYDTIRLNLIPAAMEAENLESPVNVAGVGRISLTGDLYVSIGAEEPEEGKDYKADFYNWLHANGMGDLITESVNPSTLKAWAKARIKEGKPYPADLLKITPFTRASITKAK